MIQIALFDSSPPSYAKDVTPADAARLQTAQSRVRHLMLDGQWRTIAQVAAAVGCSENGAAARLRELRKPRNGGYTVERRRVSGGLWEYRVKQ